VQFHSKFIKASPHEKDAQWAMFWASRVSFIRSVLIYQHVQQSTKIRGLYLKMDRGKFGWPPNYLSLDIALE
jgi:hypothetical protein